MSRGDVMSGTEFRVAVLGVSGTSVGVLCTQPSGPAESTLQGLAVTPWKFYKESGH